MNVLSESFVEEMRKKLSQEKQQIQERIKELKPQDPFADPEHVNDNAAVDHDAQEEDGHERIAAMVEESDQQVAAIDQALQQMDQGTYGICTNCGKSIGEDRLRVFPTATKCMDCENKKNN